MKQESLSEFTKRVNIINKEIAEYYNEETGSKFMIPSSYLWTRVDYLELTNEELKKAIFNQEVDKIDNLKYIDTTRPAPKYESTKREEDKYTIIDAKVKANQLWLVSNGLKYKETFNNKEDAIKLADKINDSLKQML
ncbi:MAG: hypothetical protein II006_03375 [Peptostreptococcaceae bacterium]|nr:hypothetical protein [Peptostreptococcaceae bacterium]